MNKNIIYITGFLWVMSLLGFADLMLRNSIYAIPFAIDWILGGIFFLIIIGGKNE